MTFVNENDFSEQLEISFQKDDVSETSVDAVNEYEHYQKVTEL